MKGDDYMYSAIFTEDRCVGLTISGSCDEAPVSLLLTQQTQLN